LSSATMRCTRPIDFRCSTRRKQAAGLRCALAAWIAPSTRSGSGAGQWFHSVNALLFLEIIKLNNFWKFFIELFKYLILKVDHIATLLHSLGDRLSFNAAHAVSKRAVR
jgi:hypothetical protein